VSLELATSGRWPALAWQLGLHLAGGLAMVALGAWAVRALLPSAT
jgi:fluoride ion exporter CrcB/FEX